MKLLTKWRGKKPSIVCFTVTEEIPEPSVDVAYNNTSDTKKMMPRQIL